jgi:hypothetical protein
MPEIIQGTWEELAARTDLRGRRIRAVVIDEATPDDPWLRSLQSWADNHRPLGHRVEDSREGIYAGTVDDPR